MDQSNATNRDEHEVGQIMIFIKLKDGNKSLKEKQFFKF